MCSLLPWPVDSRAVPPPMWGQNIPQAVYENGFARKIHEAPSKEGTLVIQMLVRGLNEPQSAIWVPMRSFQKFYSDPYARFSGGAWLISERKGGIWVLYQENLYPLLDLPPNVEPRGEGGYLDLLYNPWSGGVFLSYARQLSQTLSTVSVQAFTLKYSSNQFHAVGVTEVFQAQPPLQKPAGYGGALAANREFLYIGLGTGSQPQEAQNLQSHWGSVNKISLHQDQQALREVFPGSRHYLSPALAEQASATSQMVSIGHAEIYDLFWDNHRHQLWSVEQLRLHNGIVLADELNLFGEGHNYGWGLEPAPHEVNTESGQASSLGRDQAAILSWTRPPGVISNRYHRKIDNSANTIANTMASNARPGMGGSAGWGAVLVLPPQASRSPNLFAAWAGDLIIAGLEGQSLYRMRRNPDPTQESGFRLEFREPMLKGLLGPIRWLGLGPDGAIYLLTYSHAASGSRMLRLSPKSRMFPR